MYNEEPEIEEIDEETNLENSQLLALIELDDWYFRGIAGSLAIALGNIARYYPQYLNLAIILVVVAAAAMLFVPPRDYLQKSLYRTTGIAIAIGFCLPRWDLLAAAPWWQWVLVALGALAGVFLLGILGGNDE